MRSLRTNRPAASRIVFLLIHLATNNPVIIDVLDSNEEVIGSGALLEDVVVMTTARAACLELVHGWSLRERSDVWRGGVDADIDIMT